MFFNPQPPEIPESGFPADGPQEDPATVPHADPDAVPSDDPLNVPPQDPLDVPSDVPTNGRDARFGGLVATGVDANPHHMIIAVTGTAMIIMLTAMAVFAAQDGKGMDKTDKDKMEHGQGFEGPNGKPTFMNRKMRGHQHHEDRPARTSEHAKHWQDKRMWRQEGTWQGADTWANARAKDWKAERTTWPMRGGYGGAFITQAEYEKHYTVAHDFRIGKEPKMKNGYAHFTHEGDHFVIVDPYPENWNGKWHESDDVYMEYNQGYYLINRQHPGSPVAVMVLE